MLRSISFHNANLYHTRPDYMLTDEQVNRLMAVLQLLNAAAQLDEQQTPLRHQLLLSQLAFGYELLNYYRGKQDKDSMEERQTVLLKKFCNLVATHFRESREVKFYAKQLNLTPKHLSKVLRKATDGISPSHG